MGQKYFVTVTPAGTSVNLEADPYLFPQATAEELARQITALREESVNIGKELDAVSQAEKVSFEDYGGGRQD